jgi:hypothetical protein
MCVRRYVSHRIAAVFVGVTCATLAACESRAIEITKIGLLESGDEVSVNADVGVEVANAGNAALEFRWQAQRGRLDMAVTKTPVNIYRAPADAGLDTLKVTVVAGEQKVNRAIQLTVVDKASPAPRPAAAPPQVAAPPKLPRNVQLLIAAFESFNADRFEQAIAAADRCIDEFRAGAAEQQAELERAKVPRPPIGKVTDAQRKAIEERGLLNDVATCFWIKGRAAQSLSRVDQAREAYEAAARLSYARCWDPAGFFWSPPDDARNRLAGMK